jgi:hypothetical protein
MKNLVHMVSANLETEINQVGNQSINQSINQSKMPMYAAPVQILNTEGWVSFCG